MTERDCEVEFIVRIRSFGQPHVVRRQITETLLLAMHRSFDEGQATVLDADRNELVFDALAHDGEHPGHDGPAVRVCTCGGGHGFHSATCAFPARSSGS